MSHPTFVNGDGWVCSCRCLRCRVRCSWKQLRNGCRYRIPACCALRFVVDNWTSCRHSGCKRGSTTLGRDSQLLGRDVFVPCNVFHRWTIEPPENHAPGCGVPA